MKVIHYTSAKHGLSAIRDQRLKVALYEDLNDPFEMYSASSKDPYTRCVLEGVKNDFNSIMGLLCFSKTWRNPVMWSHYADRHKGMALEFEVPDELLTVMKYRSSRQLIDLRDGLTALAEKKTLIQRLVETKFLHWEYEQEVRMHVGHHETLLVDGLRFYKFGPDLQFKRVFLGPLCEVTDSEIAASLPKGIRIKVTSTRLAFQTFRVVFQKKRKPRWVKNV